MPMDTSNAKKVVAEYLMDLKDALALWDWKLDVLYGAIDGGSSKKVVRGQCTADARYRHATVELDPEHHDDEDDLLETMLHELVHIFHAEINVYRSQIRQFVKKKTWYALEEQESRVVEDIVWRVMRMLQVCGIDAKELIRLRAACLARDAEEKEADNDGDGEARDVPAPGAEGGAEAGPPGDRPGEAAQADDS